MAARRGASSSNRTTMFANSPSSSGASCAPRLRIDDVCRPHVRRRHDQDTECHGFEQDETTSLGPRREHEQVAGAVAVEQLALARRYPTKRTCWRESERADVRLARGQRRPFARDDEYAPGLLRRTWANMRNRVDVLLVSDAADVHQHRLSRPDAELRAKALAVAGGETLHFHAGRNDVHRTLHAVVDQRLLHRARRYDERVEHVAL